MAIPAETAYARRSRIAARTSRLRRWFYTHVAFAVESQGHHLHHLHRRLGGTLRLDRAHVDAAHNAPTGDRPVASGFCPP